MTRKFEKQVFTYDVLRKLITSEYVAMELWRVISATKMKPDKVKLLLDAVNSLSEESQQIDLINAVWRRYYQLIAEQLLP